MAYVLTDAQLEQICENSPECGCKCLTCEAFAANYHYHHDDADDDDEDY